MSSKIDKISSDIYKSLSNQAFELDSNSDTNQLYFIVNILIIIFFIYIIVSNILKTIKVYNDNNSFVTKFFKTSDDYDYNDYFNKSKNDLKVIDKTIKTKSKIHSSTFDNIGTFKRKHNIDSNLYSIIDNEIIKKQYDNYIYDVNKTGESFWNLLFSKAKYDDVVNKLHTNQ